MVSKDVNSCLTTYCHFTTDKLLPKKKEVMCKHLSVGKVKGVTQQMAKHVIGVV